MCLLIAELLLFGTGLYLAISGKMPPSIAGKGYSAEGSTVRVIGVILALPLPLAFCTGVVMGIIDPELVNYAAILEGAMVLGSAIIAMVMIRQVRKPIEASQAPAAIQNIEPK
jgi:hypothetical protein